MNWFELLNDVQPILEWVAQVIAGASIMANYTKTDKDNRALSKAGKVVNFLAMNWFTLRKPKFND